MLAGCHFEARPLATMPRVPNRRLAKLHLPERTRAELRTKRGVMVVHCMLHHHAFQALTVMPLKRPYGYPPDVVPARRLPGGSRR